MNKGECPEGKDWNSLTCDICVSISCPIRDLIEKYENLERRVRELERR